MSSNAPLLNASVYLRSHASIAGRHVNVGMMTSGGLAPCLSSSVAQLAKYWIEALEEGKICKHVPLLPREHWQTTSLLRKPEQVLAVLCIIAVRNASVTIESL